MKHASTLIARRAAFLIFVVACQSSAPDLDPAVCSDQCTIAATRCSGDGVATCKKMASGCTDWDAALACAGAHEVCSGGACTASCSDQCTAGASRCSGTGVAMCKTMASGCTDWDTPAVCTGAHEVCSGGACTTSCSDQCTAGAMQCSGTGVATCKTMASGCMDWDTPAACTGAHEVCSGGACTATCSDQCTLGATVCSGTGMATCKMMASGCTDWDTPAACAGAHEICSGGVCTATCSDQCTLGATQCSGSGVAACKTMATGCTDWDTPAACTGAHEVCSGGICAAVCTDQCTIGATRCDGTGVAACKTMATGCTDWDTPVACAGAHEVCSGGVCAATCSDQCTSGATQCSGSGVSTCRTLASGCTDWDTPAACTGAHDVCSGGVCAATCSDQCALGASRCSGSDVQACITLGSGCTDWDTPAACDLGDCSAGACRRDPLALGIHVRISRFADPTLLYMTGREISRFSGLVTPDVEHLANRAARNSPGSLTIDGLLALEQPDALLLPDETALMPQLWHLLEVPASNTHLSTPNFDAQIIDITEPIVLIDRQQAWPFVPAPGGDPQSFDTTARRVELVADSDHDATTFSFADIDAARSLPAFADAASQQDLDNMAGFIAVHRPFPFLHYQVPLTGSADIVAGSTLGLGVRVNAFTSYIDDRSLFPPQVRPRRSHSVFVDQPVAVTGLLRWITVQGLHTELSNTDTPGTFLISPGSSATQAASGTYLVELWSNGAPQSRALVSFDPIPSSIEARRLPFQSYLTAPDGTFIRVGSETFPGPTVGPGRYVVTLFGHELTLDAYSAGFLRLTVDGVQTTELSFDEQRRLNSGFIFAGTLIWNVTLDPATMLLHAVFTPPQGIRQEGSIHVRAVDLR